MDSGSLWEWIEDASSMQDKAVKAASCALTERGSPFWPSHSSCESEAWDWPSGAFPRTPSTEDGDGQGDEVAEDVRSVVSRCEIVADTSSSDLLDIERKESNEVITTPPVSPWRSQRTALPSHSHGLQSIEGHVSSNLQGEPTAQRDVSSWSTSTKSAPAFASHVTGQRQETWKRCGDPKADTLSSLKCNNPWGSFGQGCNGSDTSVGNHSFLLGRVYGVMKCGPCSVGWAVYSKDQAVGVGEGQRDWHYFTVDEVLTYHAFSDDFGPLNIGCVFKFRQMLLEKLHNGAQSVIVLYTRVGDDPRRIANSAFLLGSFMILQMGMTPEQAWDPFSKLEPCPFQAYRDATFSEDRFPLTLLDCFKGLYRALHNGFLDGFNMELYELRDDPANGDMHEVVPGKFVAFKGPIGGLPDDAEWRDEMGCVRTFSPKYYVDIFRQLGVSSVVRANEARYDGQEFVKNNIRHEDMYFEDCAPPPSDVVQRFLDLAESTSGIIAVHCKAGLGRTGTLIALYMMKHFGFSARDSIAWLRIMRPGSVVGQQQHYLERAEKVIRGVGNSDWLWHEEGLDGLDEARERAQELERGSFRREALRRSASATPQQLSSLLALSPQPLSRCTSISTACEGVPEHNMMGVYGAHEGDVTLMDLEHVHDNVMMMPCNVILHQGMRVGGMPASVC